MTNYYDPSDISKKPKERFMIYKPNDDGIVNIERVVDDVVVEEFTGYWNE